MKIFWMQKMAMLLKVTKTVEKCHFINIVIYCELFLMNSVWKKGWHLIVSQVVAFVIPLTNQHTYVNTQDEKLVENFPIRSFNKIYVVFFSFCFFFKKKKKINMCEPYEFKRCTRTVVVRWCFIDTLLN